MSVDVVLDELDALLARMVCAFAKRSERRPPGQAGETGGSRGKGCSASGLRSGTGTPTKRAPLHETVSGPRITISFAEPNVLT